MTRSKSKMKELEEEMIFLDLEIEDETLCPENNSESLNEFNDTATTETNRVHKTTNKMQKHTEGILNQGLREVQFNKYLVEAIDEALASLGEPVKNTLYQHLENDFGIPKDKIPEKIFKFSDIIHQIFGLGAPRLEIKFMENLNAKIQTMIKWPEYEWPLSRWAATDFSFTEYVFNARKSYQMQAPKTH